MLTPGQLSGGFSFASASIIAGMFDASFIQAMETVFEHEGGFVDDPVDPGGATNFGVSLRFLVSIGELDLDDDGIMDGDFNYDGKVDVQDIKDMDREDAMKLYHLHWWDKYGYGDLPAGIAVKVFDLAVNMGAKQAHKLLQRACRATGANLTEDGIIGPQTRFVIQGLDQWGLMTALRSEAAGFYRVLIAQKPHFEKYRNGWLRRAYA